MALDQLTVHLWRPRASDELRLPTAQIFNLPSRPGMLRAGWMKAFSYLQKAGNSKQRCSSCCGGGVPACEWSCAHIQKRVAHAARGDVAKLLP